MTVHNSQRLVELIKRRHNSMGKRGTQLKSRQFHAFIVIYGIFPA